MTGRWNFQRCQGASAVWTSGVKRSIDHPLGKYACKYVCVCDFGGALLVGAYIVRQECFLLHTHTHTHTHTRICPTSDLEPVVWSPCDLWCLWSSILSSEISCQTESASLFVCLFVALFLSVGQVYVQGPTASQGYTAVNCRKETNSIRSQERNPQPICSCLSFRFEDKADIISWII